MDPDDETTPKPLLPERPEPEGATFESVVVPAKQRGNGKGSLPVPATSNETAVVSPVNGGDASFALVQPGSSNPAGAVPEHVWLDSYHQEFVQRVLDKDTSETRRGLAAYLAGVLTDDIGALRADQADIGSREQIDAIRATGWCGWARFFVVAAWVIAAIDAIVWAFGAARVLNIR